MDEFNTDVIIIGAGVIGLATARALALAGREVILLESEPMIAVHTSSRNSEVIHAGIYYAAGSNKARFCVEGRRQLYSYLDSHGVTYKACGKLVVAQADEADLHGVSSSSSSSCPSGMSMAATVAGVALSTTSLPHAGDLSLSTMSARMPS